MIIDGNIGKAVDDNWGRKKDIEAEKDIETGAFKKDASGW